MSNGIRFDPLLVHYLAGELDQLLRGRECAAAPLFVADRTVVLPLNRGEGLRFDLHPTRGWIRIVPVPGLESPDAVCVGVEAPPDERILHFHLDLDDRFRPRRRTLTVELHTNQWNAILHEDGKIESTLWRRRAGTRDLAPGRFYVPPSGAPRFGLGAVSRERAWEAWMERLGSGEDSSLSDRLVSGFAYTGAINADWILTGAAPGTPESPVDLRAAFDRWWWLRSLPPAEPCVLDLPRGPQPYPLRLAGESAERHESLLAAMSAVAELVPLDKGADRLEPARRVAARELDAARRRLDRLEAQLTATEDVERLRTIGDLLLARIDSVPRGETHAVIEDWEGNPVEVELDPRLTPADNAARYYDEARRCARAAEQLPALIAAARRDVERWTEASRQLEEGTCPEWLEELVGTKDRQQKTAAGAVGAPAPPYRVFRTSGGLEVRVGRSARDNDRLTFHESKPDDVWLHARSVPGSHVILRWSDPNAAPPARDLREAAQLAAVFSRSRTSSTVAVDWTRRKYVRKPRGAPPGTVIPQRVKTLFVEPDERIVRMLAADRDEPESSEVSSDAYPRAPDGGS